MIIKTFSQNPDDRTQEVFLRKTANIRKEKKAVNEWAKCLY